MSKRAALLVPKLRFPEFQGASAWKACAGSDLFNQINERSGDGALPVLAITQEHGAIPRELIDYHVSVMEKSLESYKVVEPGDFIISLRSFQGGIEYSQYRGICRPAYVILRRRGEGVDAFFRHYFKAGGFIQALTKNLEGLRDGKMISYKQFSELRLPVPTVREQQKIADCLGSLEALIGAQARKVDALKVQREGLMHQLLPKEADVYPQKRFSEFQNASGWQRATLGDIAEIRSGSTPSRSNDAFFAGGTIPWVKTTDLNNSYIAQTEECITPAARARVNPPGSILVAMYGGLRQIGRTGCLRVPAATNQAISVLQLNQKAATPAYVLAWLNAKVGDWKRVASSSRKDPNITAADVAGFQIKLPGVSEQKRIADCLASFEALITVASLELEALQTHKRGLMQQLLPSAAMLAA